MELFQGLCFLDYRVFWELFQKLHNKYYVKRIIEVLIYYKDLLKWLFIATDKNGMRTFRRRRFAFACYFLDKFRYIYFSHLGTANESGFSASIICLTLKKLRELKIISSERKSKDKTDQIFFYKKEPQITDSRE
jgi:hypothetical protein